MIRPFEFSQKHGGRLFDDRLENKTPIVALMCSFRKATESELSPFYDFESLKYVVKDVCSELEFEFRVVGENLNSHVWMQETMELLLGSTQVIIDISDPRPNVLYELGILCSFREEQSVTITIDDRAKLDSSEVYQ